MTPFQSRGTSLAQWRGPSEGDSMRSKRSRERGYTLTEALVVVGIIGIISLVAVPNFIALYRQAKVKGAVMQFSNDLRGARQTAATKYRPVMVSIGTSTAEQGSYWISQWDGSAWVGARKKDLEPNTSINKAVFFSFPANSYTDTVTADGASRRDIIFDVNGGVRTIPTNPVLRIYTNQNIAKKIYNITIHGSGSVQVQ
jgi:prepilin-type N-terminal cleavage/methylation domain-containing protein